jgi:hypothetical protein
VEQAYSLRILVPRADYCISTIGARQKANFRAVGLSTLT